MPQNNDEYFDQLGKALRESLGIDEQIKLSPADVLRRMKHFGYISDYVRLPDCELPNDEARFVADARRIDIRESVYQGAENGNTRYFFTIFHEIAHAALNHQHTRRRGISVSAFEKAVGSIARDEREADRLTAAIISPFHRADFSLKTTAQQLAEKFGLGPKASQRRLEELQGIYRRLHKIKRDLPPGVFDFLAKRKSEGFEVTSITDEEITAMRAFQPKFEGTPCPNASCGEFTMVRRGTQMRCASCGAITGDD